MSENKVTYASEEAAKFVTNISGWVDTNGRFWGMDEHMARWSGCTHITCECGNEYTKGWTCCESCRDTHKLERFNKLEKKVWDGETPICLFDSDEYFFDYDSLLEYVEEGDIELKNMRFQLCKPIPMNTLDKDYFLEGMHEDAELPCEIIHAITALNKLVMQASPISWEPEKYEAIVKL